MKLSQRLQTIDQMITEPYGEIWDCCCDHGFLGAALLQRGAAETIHFVDVVPGLTLALEDKLTQLSSGPLAGRLWQVHCMDVAQLELPDNAGRQMVIIAGVGGDLTLEMVEAISRNHPDRELEFMLCPVHHIYKVRTRLAELGFGLIDETLIEENRRFYEVLHLSNREDRSLSDVGSDMWDLSRSTDQNYLQRLLDHYGRVAAGGCDQAAAALQAYRQLQA